MSYSHSEDCLSSNRFGDGFDCIGYPRCHLAPKPKVNWKLLRETLKRMQNDWVNAPTLLTMPQGNWDAVGLEALGFEFHPELRNGRGAWVYTFDRTPPDPNG